MEDAATAEISRAQVWQWVHHGVTLADGTRVTAGLVGSLLDQEVARLGSGDPDVVARARSVFEHVALADDFPTFLTLLAYDLLP
jgi:malate synthase